MAIQPSGSPAWQDVVTSALLGTERQSFSLPRAGGMIEELLQCLDTSDAERALLGAAALLSLYERAGHKPLKSTDQLPAPCEPDDTPVCSPVAAQHLATMLAGQYNEALPEWLELAAGRRVPEEYLPTLLQLGTSYNSFQMGAGRITLREGIMSVLGRRGRWLAAQNPAWKYAVDWTPFLFETTGEEGEVAKTSEVARVDEAWQTGNRDARIALLEHLRQSAPNQARELAASTWQQEAARERTDFLKTFAHNLGSADEAFLEAALDDKSKDVRRAAFDLLVRLPDSALVNRMKERARPLLTMSANRKNREQGKIKVTLPEACDASMTRDGIEAKLPQHSGIGEKAWWLQQIIAAIPPRFWVDEWQMQPGTILEASKGEWQTILLNGWRQAIVRFNDETWAEAMLELFHANPEKPEKHVSTVPLGTLMEVLPDERREAWAMRVLDSLTVETRDANIALEALRFCRRPWSLKLSRVVLERLRTAIGEEKDTATYNWQLQQALRGFGTNMNPAIIEEIGDNWPTDSKNWQYWRQPIRDWTALLQFRFDMIEALKTQVPGG